MNVEGLHSAIIDILSNEKSAKTVSIFENLVRELENRVNDPANPAHQKNFSEAFSSLREASGKYKHSTLPVNIKNIMTEMDIEHLNPELLLKQINAVLSENQLTLDIALSELKELLSEVKEDVDSLRSMKDSFSRFSIDKNELSPGESELGFLIPRAAIDSKLSAFEKEIKELGILAKCMSEITTGNREEPKVSFIASSEFLVYIFLVPAALKLFSEAFLKIIEVYEKIVSLRNNYSSLRGALPDNITDPIKAHLQDMMNEEIDKFVEEHVKSVLPHNMPKERKNELKNEARKHFLKVAAKIDRGYAYEMRAKEPENVDSEKAEDIALVEAVNIINQAGAVTQIFQIIGEPVLQIEEDKD